MNTFHRTTALLLITVTILLNAGDGIVPAAATSPSIASPATPIVESATEAAQLSLINASVEQTELVTEAIAQFEDAGLDLPPLEIEFHDDDARCKGFEGIHRPAPRDQLVEADRILMCNRMKIILLHELAHAWKHHNLSEETRAAFAEHWDLDNWNDMAAAWGDRAVERAAHTIAFTLNQHDPNVSAGVLRYLCGYELLTGRTTEIHSEVSC